MPIRRHLIWAAKMLLDLSLLGGAFLIACLIRFEGDLPPFVMDGLSFTLPLTAGVQFLCLAVLAPHHWSWRHLSLSEALRVAGALGLAGILFGVWRIFGTSARLPWFRAEDIIPWGVIVFDLLVGCTVLLGVRVACRLFSERRKPWRRTSPPRHATLLIGAGRAGAMVAREIAARPEVGLHPVGFLDDNADLWGLRVGGVPVIGPTRRLAEVARRHAARQALITIANASAADINRLSRLCRDCGLAVKIIPSLHEIINGRIDLTRIRNIAVEDLLHREPIPLDGNDLRTALSGRRVLVTGAGGSIGSELCRKVCGLGVESLALVERAENSLFDIHRRLLHDFPRVHVVPCLADIRDPLRMRQIFTDLAPDTVFHAAAHKHVPLMESNPNEAIKNNVLGTAALARLADECGVGQFVMISTDKAVKPSSIMGVSKRVAELFVQAFARRSRTRFVTVRFGNVLGSNGSVVPLFREQIARGGPVTVTHPEMRRYFMTIPEACTLVLQAAIMGKGGEIFILDMGEPVKIVDLARQMISLSGLVPGEDVQIQFTGLRPGEKLSEELFSYCEDVGKTAHPRISVGRREPPEWTTISRQVEELGELAIAGEIERMYAKLREIVPDYQSRSPDYDPVKWLRRDVAHAGTREVVEVRVANGSTP